MLSRSTPGSAPIKLPQATISFSQLYKDVVVSYSSSPLTVDWDGASKRFMVR
jgi:hypothetical protein